VFNEIFHPISRRLVAKCDGCLRIGGASAGADEMVALAKSHGKAIYTAIEAIPDVSGEEHSGIPSASVPFRGERTA
jgi:hypothetical protein